MYHTIYSQDGQMFEVPATKASKLLAEGWTVAFPEDLSAVFTAVPEEAWDEDESELFENFLADLPESEEKESSNIRIKKGKN